MAPLLDVRGLEVTFPTRRKPVRALQGVDLRLQPGEVLGLVGESGSGKSVMARAIMGLLAHPGHVSGGQILFEGRDLVGLGPDEMRALRGNRMAMIFQDPMATLNPVLRIEEQMAEALLAHDPRMPREAVRARCLEVLRQVGIPAPEERLRGWPHEFSGGMRQRIIIATALLNRPALILADEATTALDVTIQAQILHEMRVLCEANGTALVWITHDLAVVSGIADHIAVMYAGRIVESGPAGQVLGDPRHPYTRGLLGSIPDNAQPGSALAQIPGLMPSPADLPRGCAFRPRCDRAGAGCGDATPPETKAGDRVWRCLHPLNAEVPA
ncbi:MAG: ABC transporter ATP-binding protein [Paracoccaceae bacterium]